MVCCCGATQYGVTEFTAGCYNGFDRLAASGTVKAAKHSYPGLKLTPLLSHHPADQPIPAPDGLNRASYPPGMESVPRKIAIVRANRYVVDHVDYLIAYAWHPASNARELADYAKGHKRIGKIMITEIDRFRLNEYTKKQKSCFIGCASAYGVF